MEKYFVTNEISIRVMQEHFISIKHSYVTILKKINDNNPEGIINMLLSLRKIKAIGIHDRMFFSPHTTSVKTEVEDYIQKVYQYTFFIIYLRGWEFILEKALKKAEKEELLLDNQYKYLVNNIEALNPQSQRFELLMSKKEMLFDIYDQNGIVKTIEKDMSDTEFQNWFILNKDLYAYT